MSALSIQVPFPVFNDRDGQPLDNGYVWIGVPNLPPQTNPVNVYFDEALTILAAQPLRTINGYISRFGSPAQVYIDGVNFSILVQNSKGSMVYNFPEATGIGPNASGVSFTGFKGQVGTVQDIADNDGSDWIGFEPAGSGAVARSAQDKMRETVSVKDFGAVGDGVTDDSDAIQSAIDFLIESQTLYIPKGLYYITKEITVSNKNINIDCDGELLLENNDNCVLRFTYSGTTVSGTNLVLPEKGNSQLVWNTPPTLPKDPSNYFVVLSSTENLITRIGNAAFTPYKKRECLNVTSWDWRLKAQNNITYTVASDLSVILFEKRRQVSINNLSIKLVSGASTTVTPKVSLFGASNITFNNLKVDCSQINTAGVAVFVLNSAQITVNNANIIGLNSLTGDSYQFEAFSSAFLTFNDCYNQSVDTVSPRMARGYSSRHSSNVAFNNCYINGIDDHWGYNYFVNNCIFIGRIFTFAGGDATITNCSSLGGSGLIEIRQDTPFCDGKLFISNCKVSQYLVYFMGDTSDPLGRTTDCKFFDTVSIENCVINAANVDVGSSAMIIRPPAVGSHTYTKTTKINVSNLTYNRLTATIGANLMWGMLSPTQSCAKLIEFVDIFYDPIVYVTSGTFAERAVIGLRQLIADEVYVRNWKNLSLDQVAADRFTIVDSHIGPPASDPTAVFICNFVRGEVVIDNCTLNVFGEKVGSASLGVSIKNCLFEKNFIFTTLTNDVNFMSRNVANLSVTLANLPGSDIEYYIRAARYKTS